MKKLLAICFMSLFIIIVITGCQKNQSPVINSIAANPDSVYPTQQVSLSANAEDPDGDELTFTWAATIGTLSATTGQSINWTAPDDTGRSTITVIAKDPDESADTLTKTIKVYPNWVEGENNTAISIYDTITTFSQITISGVPSQAKVDSVAITVDINHSDPTDLKIWLKSPDGTEITLWDGNFPGGSVVALTDLFADESVNGTWTFLVYDKYVGDEGTLNSWAICVDWKF